MRMLNPQMWSQQLQTPAALQALVAAGEAVDVSARLGLAGRGEMLALASDLYDALVCWDGQAMREHGICLDEADRLDSLLQQCAPAIASDGGCCICCAVDSRKVCRGLPRHTVCLTNYGSRTQPMWLAHF